MIVLCRRIISATTKQDLGEKSPWLKKGKQYIVLALTLTPGHGVGVFLQSEQPNSPTWFSVDGFEFISNTIPSSWVREITDYYGKKSLTMLPNRWNYESFWEDLDDGEPAAWDLFEAETAQMYKEEGWFNPEENK